MGRGSDDPQRLAKRGPDDRQPEQEAGEEGVRARIDLGSIHPLRRLGGGGLLREWTNVGGGVQTWSIVATTADCGATSRVSIPTMAPHLGGGTATQFWGSNKSEVSLP